MLLDYGRNVNINATLIFQGYATVARRTEPVFQPTVQALLAEQEKARQAHRNLFRYGDFEDEGDL
jgi:endonuclease YncB( thermonuclease family)